MVAQPPEGVYSNTMQSYAARKPRFRVSLQEKQRQTLTTTTLAGTETSLYYFGARYLDPKTSRWISADPAMYDGSYIPSAPINDEARKRNGNLPGLGGVFNYVNFHVYHYAGNNPINLTDPNGMWDDNGDGTWTAVAGDTLWGLYGADWKEKSGYTGDPRKLQVGEKVGRQETANKETAALPSNSETSKQLFSNNSVFGNIYARGAAPNEIGLVASRITAYAMVDKKKNTVSVWAMSTQEEKGEVSSITEASIRGNGIVFESGILRVTGANIYSADNTYLGSIELQLPPNYKNLDLTVITSTRFIVNMPSMGSPVGSKVVRINLGRIR